MLSGGIGGATFTQGLLGCVDDETEITVIGNTADDIWLHGLKVCPDLDTLMYTLGGGIDPERRWGRAEETWAVKDELAAYGAEPTWFGLGDRDVATHLVRTQMLSAGYSLTDVTRALCVRWQPGVRLLPMSDDRVESHVVVDDEESPSGRRAIHFQEYWVRLRASVPARDVVMVGIESARPAAGVVEAIAEADVVVLPPSNPVVSIGPIVAVPGIGEALRTTTAPVVGVSPIIGGGAVRGMADQLLDGLGVEVSAGGVGTRYGARATGGLLDGWLVDTSDADQLDVLEDAGLRTRAVPLYMSDEETTAQLVRDTLALAEEARA
ncbi:LPPG:FO 2-phospho-L-lactate transferase [Mumia flava]|uniref:LPPG:FO 2-phospho-L-lactate transferase n=1 Tax=Mumia flava TaxID=1348852 RepID=A0A2M9BKQ3_9ACTN|nr:LPPG:FO 2-phospho-L-lactate transferase [Mumia flava]